MKMYRVDIVMVREDMSIENRGYDLITREEMCSYIKKDKQEALNFVISMFNELADDPYFILESIEENMNGYGIFAKYLDNDMHEYEIRCYEYETELFKDLEVPMFTKCGKGRNFIVPLFTLTDKNGYIISRLDVGRNTVYHYNGPRFYMEDFGSYEKFDIKTANIVSKRWSKEEVKKYLDDLAVERLLDN